MKISLVTNRTIIRMNNILLLENIVIKSENTKMLELCGIKDKQIAELLKEKEILAYRAASAFLGKNKKDGEHEK